MRALAVPLLLLSAVAACSSDSTGNGNPGPTGDVSIVSGASTMGANAFDPPTFTISLASKTAVKWVNDDGTSHSIQPDVAGTFTGSGNLGPNSTFQAVFTAPGTYDYHCGIHPSMTGTIIVNK